MNEMNPLETQLRSWIPRRPSAKLTRRLFRRPAPVTRPAGIVFWLGPVTACLLFACVIVGQHGPANFSSAGRDDAIIAMVLSNQSYAAYLPGSFQPAANRLDTFEWTNRGYSNSTMDSRTSPKATDL